MKTTPVGCPPNHPQNQRKHMDFHSFWNEVGGGRVPPPTYKIKENILIFIVFGVRWGGPGAPPHPQNQRKHMDFHSFWNGVGGAGAIVTITDEIRQQM